MGNPASGLSLKPHVAQRRSNICSFMFAQTEIHNICVLTNCLCMFILCNKHLFFKVQKKFATKKGRYLIPENWQCSFEHSAFSGWNVSSFIQVTFSGVCKCKAFIKKQKGEKKWRCSPGRYMCLKKWQMIPTVSLTKVVPWLN